MLSVLSYRSTAMPLSNLFKYLTPLSSELLAFSDETPEYRHLMAGFAKRQCLYALLAHQLRNDEGIPVIDPSLTEVRRHLEKRGIMSYGASQRFLGWLEKKGHITSRPGRKNRHARVAGINTTLEESLYEHTSIWLKHSVAAMGGRPPAEAQLRATPEFIKELDRVFSSVTDEAWRQLIASNSFFAARAHTEPLLCFLWLCKAHTEDDGSFTINKAKLAWRCGISRSSCSASIAEFVSMGVLKQTGNAYQLPENGARLCEAFLTMRMRTFDTAFQNIELRRDQSSSKAPTNDEQQQRR